MVIEYRRGTRWLPCGWADTLLVAGFILSNFLEEDASVGIHNIYRIRSEVR